MAVAVTHTWANLLKRAQKGCTSKPGMDKICTKLTQIRERVINVREVSIKSLIWSLKELCFIMSGRYRAETLLQYYSTTAKSILQISGLLQVL